MRFYIRKDVFMRKNKTALFLAAVSLSALPFLPRELRKTLRGLWTVPGSTA